MSFIRHMKKGVHPESTGYQRPSYERRVVDGMQIESDLRVPMRDGVEILADVFRPEHHAEEVPVIIGWAAYGKHDVPGQYFPGADVDPSWISQYCPFEAPDPLYWTKHGYAVAFVNPRGTWYTDGDMRGFLNKNEAEDVHDLIEWLADQDWSNGKIGMSGVSYYAISQWFAAATQPPHLAAISPWEGFTDRYRDAVYHGGIREDRLNSMWWELNTNIALGEIEDGVRMIHEHPTFDEYWDENKVDLSRVQVPAYVVASWSDQGLHTRGTLEGFKQIGSEQKWLEVHGQKKWRYQFKPENVERLRTFFDHFLKGKDNELLSWPPVRLEVRDSAGVGTWRDEREWPLARTNPERWYLDADRGVLCDEIPEGASVVEYDSESDGDAACFVRRFDADTELTGHMKLRLWVEAPEADDLDLFVQVDKLDVDGGVVPFVFFATHADGPLALGWLRASHRELDEERSTELQPWHTHRDPQKVAPGEIVAVDIEIWPSSTRFSAGESLRVTVQGSETLNYPPGAVVLGHSQRINRGRHRIHTGGAYDSHLAVPLVPPM